MIMKPDPLLKSEAERLHYATGELLGADDFRDEQTYHRRQLARALLHLLGSGTLAGLRVVARHRPGTNGAPDEVHLEVEPGLALDRAGRLIEVPRAACLRLRRWFDFIANREPSSEELDRDDLRTAFQGGAVVADVYLAFHPCDRGYTPAFASGPFDALDASQPSRVRDAYELTLLPSAEPNPPLAPDPWEALEGETPEARLSAAQQASLNAWQKLAFPSADPAGQNPNGIDPAAIFLARVTIPAGAAPDAESAPAADWSAASWPEPTPGQTPNIDNTTRRFLLPPALLAHLAGLTT